MWADKLFAEPFLVAYITRGHTFKALQMQFALSVALGDDVNVVS